MLFPQDNLPGWSGISDGLVHARQNGLLTSSAIDDQQVPISPQLALASRRQFSSRVRARPPNSNDGENIPSQDNQRVN